MIYVILGQTASGKTRLAVNICKKYNLPLIGADAFQIYRELNIGVDKPTPEELSGLEYSLIDEVSVTEEMNVRLYQSRVRSLLDRYVAEGRDVVLSGGTFLYVRAALYPYEFPETDGSNRSYEDMSDEQVYNLLSDLDPKTAATVHPHNRRRVEQALRLAQAGTPRSRLLMGEPKPLYPVRFFAIETEIETGNRKIDARVDQMMESGLIAEAAGLRDRYGSALRAFQAIGYKEVFFGLENGQSPEEISTAIKLNTRHYAKRQRTFLRHQFPDLIRASAAEIEQLISSDLEFKRRSRLVLGDSAFGRVERTDFLVVGLGGVGGSCFEGLVRLGAKKIRIVDFDCVENSNLNRQTVFVAADVGQLKTSGAAKFAKAISPLVEITAYPRKIDGSFPWSDLTGTEVIFDCIDDVEAKADLIEFATRNGASIYIATGSGLRTDATKTVGGTLGDTGEPLARALKKELKRRGHDGYGNLPCVYSKEVPAKRNDSVIGSAHPVPNSFGLALISLYLRSECQRRN